MPVDAVFWRREIRAMEFICKLSLILLPFEPSSQDRHQAADGGGCPNVHPPAPARTPPRGAQTPVVVYAAIRRTPVLAWDVYAEWGQNGGQITRQTKAEARLVLASLVEMGGSRTQTHLFTVVQDRSEPQENSGFGRPICSRSFRIVQRCGGQHGGQNPHRYLAISFAPLACDHWYIAMFTPAYPPGCATSDNL